MFEPPRGEALTGLHVLLIVIPRSAYHEAHFFAGRAVCDGLSISVLHAHGQRTPPIAAPPEALSGFDPEILSQLIVPDQQPLLAHLVRRIDAGVAVFADAAPTGGVMLRYAFYGLAESADGRPLLMQGDPTMFEADYEAEEPWAAPPWEEEGK